MKKEVTVLLIAVFFLLVLSNLASSQTRICKLGVSLLNQDPFPASPEDELKVVFQVTGAGNPNCKQVSLTLKEEFPFILKPGTPRTQSVFSSTFSTFEFSSTWQVPYKLLVDEKALDGDNAITLELKSEALASSFHEFDLRVENLKTDFEVTIRDYISSTNTLTFEILNIGESDVEALTIDLPTQQNLKVKGSTRNIVGSLDSNEDTTFNFEAIPSEGELVLEILYTDEINVRRALQKTVNFNPALFKDRARDQNGPSIILIVVIIIVVAGILFWIRKRYKKKKKHHHTEQRE